MSARQAETCEACHDPAEFVGFGHPNRLTCKRHRDMYVKYAGPTASVALWLPIRDVQELSLGTFATAERAVLTRVAESEGNGGGR